MSDLEVQQILALLHQPAFWILAIWLLKEVWAGSKQRLFSLEEKTTNLTIQMAKVMTQLEGISKTTDLIPKILIDVDQAHDRIREIKDA